MKTKIICVLALIAVCAVGLCIWGGTSDPSEQYLRIHIRANSNEACDQDVKYAVKQAVVDTLTPYLAGVQTKEQAMSIVESRLRDIERAADRVLAQHGMGYVSHAALCRERFPDRDYQDLTLQAGVYDALIVSLGSGTGDNWWCVVFPPLCFGTQEPEQVRYRSWIAQMWKKLFD